MLTVSLLVLSLLILALWVVRFKQTLAFLKGDHIIDSFSLAALPAPYPKVSVIIPARNEEANIGGCLASLLDQDYPNYEIIVVNDRSTDKTAAIVQAKQAAAKNVKLVQVEKLTPGWTGKNNALHHGVAHATGDWFLFTDADTVHQRSSLSFALGHAYRRRAQMLSLLPSLDNQTFWEKVLQPVAGGALMLRYPLKEVNDPKKKLGFGNGQFILIQKEIYFKIGGHAAVKDVMLEDVAMGKLAKSRRVALHIGYGADLFRTRMYPHFAAIFRGWSRIYYSAFGESLFFLAGLIALVWLVSLAPFFLAAYALPLLFTQFDFFSIALFGVVVLQFAVIYPTLLNTYRISRSDPAYITFYPLACVLLSAMLTHAFFKILLKQKVHWRGDHYIENRAR
jgi:glycosyltransferase involved in cell wall biosynthesis